MKNRQFDELARMYAAGISRREVLKILGTGLASATLAILGVGCGPKNDPGCDTASTCGDRHYCSDDQSCLCIKSAEGNIRCGQRPSCEVQKCKKSSDCAKLGEGYFCDTPNSGCCSDAELSRCIAPCNARANATATITATSATMTATPEAVDSTITVIGCGNDPITKDSLEAARAMLASGATDVNISPQGCAHYSRQLSAGHTTHAEVTVGGKSAIVWDHSNTESKGLQDLDLDGFFEWRSIVQREATGQMKTAEFTEYSPVNQALIRRETQTWINNKVHVKIEEADTSGALQTVHEYDADIEQKATSDGQDPKKRLSLDRVIRILQASDVCNPEQTTKLENRLKEGLWQGLNCMEKYKMDIFLWNMLVQYLEHKITFRCYEFDAFAKIIPNIDPDDPIVIDISTKENWDYFSLLEYEQRSVMWHEMTHSLGVRHAPGVDQAEKWSEADRTYACEVLCFKPNSATKCTCATCLGVNKCDERCKQFAECDSRLGYICPCDKGPNAGRYFKTCSECLSTCPSGINCFGFSYCHVIDVSCDPAARGTCP